MEEKLLNSRRQFLRSLHAYRHAVELESLASRAPDEIEHNARARMLRNGLAVAGYALPEDFLRNRTAEAVEWIGNGGTSFHDLPHKINVGATEGVFNAVKFRRQLIGDRRGSLFNHYQSHARMVASTATSSYRISPLTFAHKRSNLANRDLEEILETFKVANP